MKELFGGGNVEQELIKRIKLGDRKAFADLYNLYADYALRLALTITKEMADAADAVQETFIRVYKNINTFDLQKNFKPWFYRILINECNRILKKKNKVVLLDNYFEQKESSVSSQKDNYDFEESERLYNALCQLNEEIRIPLTLKYLIGFSEKEIAEILGINLNTLKSRLYKGRERLKKFLSQNKEKEGKEWITS